MKNLLPRVKEEIEQIKEEYPGTVIRMQSNGGVHLEIPNMPLPKWWEPPTISLLIVLQPDYPNSRPGFFTPPDVKLKENGNPPGGSSEAEIEGKKWKGYCWNPSQWDLSRETLWKFVKFAILRFNERQ
ncbi:MAG: E2/UBC family protein [Candidatus Hydrothermarchaeales archaeon]